MEVIDHDGRTVALRETEGEARTIVAELNNAAQAGSFELAAHIAVLV